MFNINGYKCSIFMGHTSYKALLGGFSVDRLSRLDLAWPIFVRGLAVAIG